MDVTVALDIRPNGRVRIYTNRRSRYVHYLRKFSNSTHVAIRNNATVLPQMSSPRIMNVKPMHHVVNDLVMLPIPAVSFSFHIHLTTQQMLTSSQAVLVSPNGLINTHTDTHSHTQKSQQAHLPHTSTCSQAVLIPRYGHAHKPFSHSTEQIKHQRSVPFPPRYRHMPFHF